MILVRYKYGNEGMARKRISYPENSFKSSGAFDLKTGKSASRKMRCNSSLSRIYRITFCIYVGCDASGMRAPVVEYLRHMDYICCGLCKSQYHIVILASVKFGPECSAFINQFLGKNREMTYIVICSQIIGSKIRLEMKCDHMIDGLARKRSLIAVYVVGTLVAYDFHILVQRKDFLKIKGFIMFMEDII